MGDNMAKELYELQIITPEKKFYEKPVKMVIFKSTEGDIGILKNHIALTTTLASGVAVIKEENQEKKAVLHGGFAEINDDFVTILTDSAEWVEEIDLKRAKEAKLRAEEYLKKRSDEIDYTRAEAALMRAIVRIEAVESK